MRYTILMALFATAFTANASSWYTTEHINENSPQVGSVKVDYPQFTQELGGAQASINEQLKKAALDMRCDADPAQAANMDYEGSIVVKTITKDFVSMVSEQGYDCSGPHPDNFTETYVFDRHSGKRVNMVVEFGGVDLSGDESDAAFDEYDKFTKKVAALLASHVPKDTVDCLKDGQTDVDIAEEIAHWSFAIGLRRDRVSFYSNPAHVIAACGFDVTLSYAEVAAALNPSPLVQSWMK